MRFFYEKPIALPVSSAKSTQHINVPEFLDMDVVMFYHQGVRKTLEELQRLERQTMSQSTPLWHQEREIRVTESRAHENRNRSNMHAICENLLTKKDLSKIAPIQVEERYEPMVKSMLKADYKNYIFRNTGLIVHPDFPFLVPHLMDFSTRAMV
ncbi:hypothetical protein PoB_007627200 [Plakobranchus ocellatus]|uniref:Uncharacterized protein n=1 Tax=Plakobranchus ocellatus TaxID=259542 RepID=A0AAV4DZK6_9GAST|nr:hypothetical protein PoB_007627200 [Plakobranchus ocellatus]